MTKKKLKKVVKTLKNLTTPNLNKIKFGLAAGKIWGFLVFVMSVCGLYGFLGGFPLWNALIYDMYGSIGFRLSWMGVILGAIYAFIDGFIIGWVFAWLYNRKL